MLYQNNQHHSPLFIKYLDPLSLKKALYIFIVLEFKLFS